MSIVSIMQQLTSSNGTVLLYTQKLLQDIKYIDFDVSLPKKSSDLRKLCIQFDIQQK